VFDGSPSMSRLRVSQRWGRVTRVYPGAVDGIDTAEGRRAAIAASPKPWAVIYDLVANSSKHDVVVDGVDLLAGKDVSEKARKEAKKILREQGGTVDNAIKKARDKLRAAGAARRLAAAAKVTMGTPRTIFDRAGVNWIRRNAPLGLRPDDHATPAMIWKLEHESLPVPRDCSKRMFKRLLGTHQSREAKGLCHMARVEWFQKRHGIDAWSLTKDQARRLRDALVAAGRKLTPQEIGDAIDRTPGEDD
jgi:hypothetical protein